MASPVTHQTQQALMQESLSRPALARLCQNRWYKTTTDESMGSLQAGQWIDVRSENAKITGIFAVVSNPTSLYDGKTCWLVNKEGKLFNYSGNLYSIDGHFLYPNQVSLLDSETVLKTLDKTSLKLITERTTNISKNSESVLQKLHLQFR